jgi:hypothetical protein
MLKAPRATVSASRVSVRARVPFAGVGNATAAPQDGRRCASRVQAMPAARVTGYGTR